MILYDFECNECHEIKEAFGKMDDKDQIVDCSCGGQAKRIVSPVSFKLEGLTGAYPSAHDQWAKKRKQHMAIEAKREAS